jgi:hypothetical protein
VTGDAGAACQRLRRHAHVAFDPGSREGVTPGLEPRLAIVDLLASSDDGHDRRPPELSGHDLQDERRLGRSETRMALLELGGIPGSLGLVKYDDVFVRGQVRVVHPVLFDERVHVLHEQPALRVAGRRPPIRGAASRIRASLSTLTSGPFPERKAAAVATACCTVGSWTAARPASVFPDPGTP